MNLGCFFVCNLISNLIFDLRLAQGENTVKSVFLEWRQQMQRGIKYRCLSEVNQNPLAVSKELNTYLADTEIKIKAGWIAYCLKSGCGKWIQNLQKRRKK